MRFVSECNFMLRLHVISKSIWNSWTRPLEKLAGYYYRISITVYTAYRSTAIFYSQFSYEDYLVHDNLQSYVLTIKWYLSAASLIDL
jgi:hypothetical protein